MTSQSLNCCRIVVVEDEYFQAYEVRELLMQAGAVVEGPTASIADVTALVAEGKVDLALLDINLGQGPSFELAGLLRREGVPFVFLTGYDDAVIPPALADVPRVTKPANEAMILELMKYTC